MAKLSFNIGEVKRIAVIDRDLCIKEKCGYVCVNVCPVNRMGKECIVVDEQGYPVISEELCVGCSICVKKCPVNAITIINISKELPKLSYSYGVNAFRLYGLPLPKEGKVVAFIGRNGIGKTTALKLLSKELLPFDLQNQPVEIREYFSALEKKSLSIKPQNIEKLRVELKVKELLEKLNVKLDSSIFPEFLLERKLSSLSGGELQKLSIAIAMAKQAHIYFFDELSNFLDVHERLSLALKVKQFAEQKTTIIVEHDLALLDYLSDYVYIFYGEENVYGAVSSIKHSRVGINEYLSGFLKSENLRFRNYEISFSEFSEGEVKEEVFQSYPRLSYSFDGFEIEVEEGEIRKGEVIGIVGRNGIGKTTFIKLLAGKIKLDNYKTELSISYKPQYLEASPLLVKELFSREELDRDVLQRAKRYLSITLALEEKPLNRISGGELQRVYLAYSISKKADLYLIDEPTAYLDIEQRVAFSQLLLNFVSEFEKPVFVVDHDILFLDRVSSRVIYVKGEPGKHGIVSSPKDKKKALNEFLRDAGITLRRDKESKRPRINKPGSVLDKKQKSSGVFFA